MQLIKWYFLLIGALSNKHSTSNIYFSVSMKNWSKFQTIYLTNSEWLPEAMSLTPSLPLFFLFCYILISSGFLKNTNQCKTFTKQKNKCHQNYFLCAQVVFVWVRDVACVYLECPILFQKHHHYQFQRSKRWHGLDQRLKSYMSDFPVRIIATAWLSGQHTKSTNKTSYIILQGERK